MQPKTVRALIYLIISLVIYWTGHKKAMEKVQQRTQDWLPYEELMDAIPLRVIMSGEEDSIPF